MKWGLENVRSRSDSDSSFRSFLNLGGVAPKAAIILAVGFLLIILGSLNVGAPKSVGEEDRIAEICAVTEGVGECRVMVTYSSDGDSVYAVAVLCEGAESAEVRGRITEMICSLYGIGAHRVSVMKLSQ